MASIIFKIETKCFVAKLPSQDGNANVQALRSGAAGYSLFAWDYLFEKLGKHFDIYIFNNPVFL